MGGRLVRHSVFHTPGTVSRSEVLPGRLEANAKNTVPFRQGTIYLLWIRVCSLMRRTRQACPHRIVNTIFFQCAWGEFSHAVSCTMTLVALARVCACVSVARMRGDCKQHAKDDRFTHHFSALLPDDPAQSALGPWPLPRAPCRSTGVGWRTVPSRSTTTCSASRSTFGSSTRLICAR